MPQYETYKESGAAWIGKIPSYWEVGRLKTYLKRTDARNPGGVQVLSLYRDLGIVPKDSRDDNHNVTSEDTSNYKYVEIGDFVVNKMKAWQGSVAVSEYEGIVSPAYYVYKFLNNKFHKRYFHYLIRSCYKDEFMRLSAGIRIGQWDLSSDDLDCTLVLIPPMEEQIVMSEFLDKKIAHIESLIEEAKASIEEYKAWKASIIYEAVTKGLNPNVEMKDSGVKGINQIPSSWKIVRFIMSNYVRARLGWKGLKAEEYVDKGFPFLSAFNIVNSQLQWENLNYITQERFDESPEIKLSVGDILLVKDGAGIGKCARIDSLPVGEATVNSSLGVITPNENIHYRYEYYYFLSPIFQNIISRLRNGMGVPHLTQEAMKEIYLPLPTLEEQIAISDYLDEKVKFLDTVIGEKESLIDDLEAYKKSLIFEVVTGKKKVC